MKRLVGILILVALVIGGVFGYTQYLEYKVKKAEEKVAHLAPQEYTFVMIANEAKIGEEAPAKPVAKPVIIAVTATEPVKMGSSRKAKRIDPITGELDEKLFPASLEEIGTVIGLYWNGELVGTYENGAKGYRETCEVKVVDRATGLLIEEKSFAGSDPPDSISEKKKSAWGSSCEDEVRNYIFSLFK